MTRCRRNIQLYKRREGLGGLMFGMQLLVSCFTNPVHAQDAIDGNRLFFTDEQRQLATSENSVQRPNDVGTRVAVEQALATAGVVENPIRTSRQSRKLEPDKALLLAQRQSSERLSRMTGGRYQVFFTALIIGPRGAHVLVNGLPCRSASGREARLEAVRVVCFGVKDDELELKVLPAAGLLEVTDKEQAVHRLRPGESW